MQVLCILAYVRAVLHKRAIPNAFCPETENALITVPAKLSLSPTRHLCLVSAFFYFCCLYFCFLMQLPQPPLDSTTSERINKEVTWLWHIFFCLLICWEEFVCQPLMCQQFGHNVHSRCQHISPFFCASIQRPHYSMASGAVGFVRYRLCSCFIFFYLL